MNVTNPDLLDERWEASDCHECHKTGHEPTASTSSKDCVVTGPNVVEDRAHTNRHHDVDYDPNPVITEVSRHVCEGPLRQSCELLQPFCLASFSFLIHKSFLL